jgi:urea transport system substrate-binding protein
VLRQVRDSAADAVLMPRTSIAPLQPLDWTSPRGAAARSSTRTRSSPAERRAREGSAAAAYFEALATPESLDFGARYERRFGPDAPKLNSLGESCFEGILLFAALAERALQSRSERLHRAADSVSFTGPRGELHLRGSHAEQRVYLAEAIDFEFSVVTQL